MPPQKKAAFVALYASSFNAHVSHLGNTELGVYWRMLLWYYVHERPLPGALEAVHRVAMATTPEEQRIVALILEQFFYADGERNDGGDVVRVWRHARADREIAQAHTRTVVASEHGRKGAAKRWQVPAGQGLLPGIAPPSLPGTCNTEPVDKYARALPEQCPSNSNQNQKVLSILRNAPPESRASVDPAPPLRHQGVETPAERLCARLLADGVNVTPSDAHLARWVAAGHTEVDIAAAVTIARTYIVAPQRIAVRYLDRVLATVQAARARAARGRR